MGEHWQRDSGHWDDPSLLLSGLSGTLSRSPKPSRAAYHVPSALVPAVRSGSAQQVAQLGRMAAEGFNVSFAVLQGGDCAYVVVEFDSCQLEFVRLKLALCSQVGGDMRNLEIMLNMLHGKVCATTCATSTLHKTCCSSRDIGCSVT